MEELAKELEEFRGAYFENSGDASKPSMMQKEVHDKRT